jgi:long-chain fatty acid transport protein
MTLSVLATTAHATNGYFSHGFGLKQKGIAGAGVALSFGPLATATNPGSMAFVRPGYDVSVSVFNPNRQYTVTGAPSMQPGTFGLAPGTFESGSKVFFIPSLGAVWNVDENNSVGVAIFGNGGMNTNYYAATFGFKPAGVDLAQLFLAPTYAIKIAEKHGLGVTPVLAFQRFKATGLKAFGGFSSSAANLSDNDYNSSLGFGARIGYLGQLVDFLSVGASFQTKIAMGAFEKYAGLFAQQGDFDIPSNWTVGIALGFEQMGLAFDVQQILYSGIKSIANPLLPNLQQAPLGGDAAAGFGWKDMTVFKGGVYLQTEGGWTWRAGYSFGKQPIEGGTNPLTSQVLFNILAPGVVEQHLTIGISKTVGEGQEIDFAVMRAFPKGVVGLNPLDPFSGQTIELKMDQWEFSLGFGF